MQSPENMLREKMNDILTELRSQKEQAGQSEKGRALAVAITQMEIASMCMIRTFFADQPYSPLNKLKPAND